MGIDRRVWLSRRAIALHVVIIIIVPTFAALCDWQVHRALSGNSLSWAYVFEWPIFGGYAMYMWWRILHEVPADGTSTITASSSGAAPAGTLSPADQEADDEMVAYNRYLAELAEHDKPKGWH